MAKKKVRTPQDSATLASEVADLEALVKRRKKAQRELDALEEGDDLDPEDAPLPGSEMIDQVLAGLGGDGSFSVTKLTDEGDTLDCGSYDLPLWPDAMRGVIKKSGGGHYVLVFHRGDGTIAKRIKRTYPGSTPVQAPASGSGDMMAFLKIMEEKDARREAAMEMLRLEAMKSSQSMITAMMQMMGAQNKPLINSATELATIAGLFQNKKSGTDLGELRDLMELLEDLKGGGGDDSPVKIETDNPLVALVPALLAALGKGLNAAPKLAPVPAPKVPVIPAPPVAARPVPPSPAPTVAPSPAPEESGLLQHAPMLKAAIDAGATPEFSAEKAWEDALAKGQGPILIDLIDNGDWKGLSAHPDLAPHAAWLESFRDELRARIPEAEPAEPIEPAAPAAPSSDAPPQEARA